MANPLKYGPAIGRLRVENGMTKGELARHLLVLPKDVDAIENGVMELSYAQINYAANTFGVDFNRLCAGEISDAVTDEFIVKELSIIRGNLDSIKEAIHTIEDRLGIHLLEKPSEAPLKDSYTQSDEMYENEESILKPIL